MSWLAVDLSSATAVTGSGILETVFPDLWVSEVPFRYTAWSPHINSRGGYVFDVAKS